MTEFDRLCIIYWLHTLYFTYKLEKSIHRVLNLIHRHTCIFVRIQHAQIWCMDEEGEYSCNCFTNIYQIIFNITSSMLI